MISEKELFEIIENNCKRTNERIESNIKKLDLSIVFKLINQSNRGLTTDYEVKKVLIEMIMR